MSVPKSGSEVLWAFFFFFVFRFFFVPDVCTNDIILAAYQCELRNGFTTVIIQCGTRRVGKTTTASALWFFFAFPSPYTFCTQNFTYETFVSNNSNYSRRASVRVFTRYDAIIYYRPIRVILPCSARARAAYDIRTFYLEPTVNNKTVAMIITGFFFFFSSKKKSDRKARLRRSVARARYTKTSLTSSSSSSVRGPDSIVSVWRRRTLSG